MATSASGTLELTSIRVAERGTADIEKAVWDELRGQREFQRLIEQGVLTASHLPYGGARLRGSCFVGHAICGPFRIELREKVHGALISLIKHATRGAFRVSELGGQATEIGPLLGLLISSFLERLGAYVSKGREFRYVQEKRTGSLAGGRLNIVRSLNLRARGMDHLLAFETPKVSFRTEINQIVAATLREVERLSRVVEIDAKTVSAARGFSLMFSDCVDYRVLTTPRTELAARAGLMASTATPASTADMLALARIIISHQSFEPEQFLSERSPRTWFINLELLFEQAVRALLSSLLRPASMEVQNGRERWKHLFFPARNLYRANPDLVLRGAPGLLAIGDVKYKNLEPPIDAGDIYQLLAHATAFDAKVCFLVFPGEAFELHYLGQTADGRKVWVASLDLHNLESSAQALVDSLILGNAITLAA